MPYLDFIKNRQQQPSEISQQKPESAKEMYAREATQQRAGQKSVQQIPESEKSQARELGARLDKATQHIRQDAPTQIPAPGGGASSPEPMLQNMMSQDKSAPALSPTSAQLGQTANEKTADAPSQSTPEKTPEKSQQRPQTIARTTPSWER